MTYVNETISNVIIMGFDTGLSNDEFVIVTAFIVCIVIMIVISPHFLRC